MAISLDLICKYGFKSTVKDELVFSVFSSGLSLFSSEKFPEAWPEDQRPLSGKLPYLLL